jgi:NAD-dependent deacetylase sirtuin 4
LGAQLYRLANLQVFSGFAIVYCIELIKGSYDFLKFSHSQQPNRAHTILSDWEKREKVFHHVTQNVDSLLSKAGCTNLTELHGSAYRVVCFDCGYRMTRDEMQVYIQSLNVNWSAKSDTLAPDADVQLSEEQIKGFTLPPCPNCQKNRLKPEIVFFGDNVLRQTVESIREKLSKSDSVLAVGTSLQVSDPTKNLFYPPTCL